MGCMEGDYEESCGRMGAVVWEGEGCGWWAGEEVGGFAMSVAVKLRRDRNCAVARAEDLHGDSASFRSARHPAH